MNNPPISSDNEISLIEHLYEVIDSKIQYSEFVMKSKIEAYSAIEESSNSQANTQSDILIALEKSNKFKEQLMLYIEKCSHQINLLLMLRKHLEEYNAKIVFDLIIEDQYLAYDKKSLLHQLKKEQPNEAPQIEEIPSGSSDDINAPAA